ncbi:MAG TPA: 50S ribosomal protein L19e [Candidatus Aenigmarchaeota archaeon]|nr:50S ribosomal protein L19e [Candidatus Aenigmarchaeota archaeon]
MQLRNQRRMAAEILKCGEEKVWIDPESMEEVSKAITKADVRRLIQRGIIKKRKVNEQSRGRARIILRQKKKGRRRGIGSRKGKKLSKTTKKKEWIKTVRPLRAMLKKLRDSGTITRAQYRKLYLMVKGGRFRSKSHLNLYLKKMIEKE